jgi:hypothetical protein
VGATGGTRRRRGSASTVDAAAATVGDIVAERLSAASTRASASSRTRSTTRAWGQRALVLHSAGTGALLGVPSFDSWSR